MNKRAISPLVSTLILITFAAALGGVVMSWGKNIEAKEEQSCDKAGLDIIKINNINQVCYSDNKIEFLIENKGEVKLNGFVVNVIGEKDVERTGIEREMSIADILKLSIPYNQEIAGNLLKIKFIPRIKERTCTEKSLDVENIRNC
jgi:hypothetical protein